MYNILFAFCLLAASALAAPECPPQDSMFFLIPHETDCSKFYICSHGTPVLQRCPDGTHFNPDFMVCQYPEFAGCDSSPPESELTCTWSDFFVRKPHPDSCSKFYVCMFGTAQVFDCPKGLEFNAKLRRCVWPHASNCSISQDRRCHSGALSKHEECSKYYICDHGVEVAMDCPTGLQWSSKVEQCVWPYESDCGRQDGRRCEDGTLSANKDCTKYNICNHGVFLAMDCPAGLHWNSELSKCVWPHESDCSSSQDRRCHSGALSKHKKCSKYYICDHGAKVAMDCPSGLQWSSKVKQCVWPHESDCGIKEVQRDVAQNGDDQIDDTQNGDAQNGDAQNGNAQNDYARNGDAQNDGAQNDYAQYGDAQNDYAQNGVEQDGAPQHSGKCEDGALSAHKDCRKYYICDHGALVRRNCPKGLHWSSELSQCVWPYESDCGRQDGRRCKDGTLSANRDCTKYNICNHGVFLAMDCPAGLHWNSRKSFCDWPASAGCKK